MAQDGCDEVERAIVKDAGVVDTFIATRHGVCLAKVAVKTVWVAGAVDGS